MNVAANFIAEASEFFDERRVMMREPAHDQFAGVLHDKNLGAEKSRKFSAAADQRVSSSIYEMVCRFRPGHGCARRTRNHHRQFTRRDTDGSGEFFGAQGHHVPVQGLDAMVGFISGVAVRGSWSSGWLRKLKIDSARDSEATAARKARASSTSAGEKIRHCPRGYARLGESSHGRRCSPLNFSCSSVSTLSSAFWSLSGLLTSHSQSTAVFHPSASRVVRFRVSRWRLLSSFDLQNSTLVCGLRRPRSQRAHPCQKHPCTRIANWYLGKTISGLPGKSLRCRRKRKPRACRAWRTANSGAVSFARTRAINELRLSAERRFMPSRTLPESVYHIRDKSGTLRIPAGSTKGDAAPPSVHLGW